MTPATPAIQAALDMLDDLASHLARYDSTHKLATHLEASHRLPFRAGETGDLTALRRAHKRQHARAVRDARAALAAAEATACQGGAA